MSRIKVNALRHTGGSSDNISLDSSGRVLVGTSSALSFASPASDVTIQTYKTAPNGLAVVSSTSSLNGDDGSSLVLARRATGGALNSAGLLLGSLDYQGFDGTNYLSAARIEARTDGTPGSNDMPGRLSFSTTADGASSPTEAMRIDSSQNLRFNSGYGSVATAYGVRAWVNFNGEGTVAIRSSGNVTSITDNATGNYSVNFTNAMPDTDYVYFGGIGDGTSTNAIRTLTARRTSSSFSTTSHQFGCVTDANTLFDPEVCTIAFIR